jgi:TetR/AcrR family transcriptional regulator, acrEF/envCD operon repressor
MKKNTRKEQKEKTRQQILQAAYSEFSCNGIQSTKTVDIANRVGLAHGTLFLHFKQRDDLLLEVVTEFGMELGRKFKGCLVDDLSIEKVFSVHLEVLAEYEPFYARLLTESGSLPKDVRNQLFLIQSGIAHYLGNALKKGISSGSIRPLPLPFLLNTWLGVLHYYLTNRDLFTTDSSVIRSHGKQLLENFINLVKLEELK